MQGQLNCLSFPVGDSICYDDRDDILGVLGRKLEALKMQKSAIGWDLEDLEVATRIEVRDRDSDSDDTSSE